VPATSVEGSVGVPPAAQGGPAGTPALHSSGGLAYKFSASDPVPAASRGN